MSKKRIMIVEDEFIIAQNLRMILESLGYEVVAHAFKAEEALAQLRKEAAELVLLDINLGAGMDGIDLAELIRVEFGIPYIFLTSHADTNTILRAKDAHPAGYLTKPFNKAELFASIEIVFASLRNTEPVAHTFIKVGSELRRLVFSDITLIQADHVYVRISRRNGAPLMVRESLHAWEEKLPKGFMRVHRSYIIALDAIQALGTGTVTVDGIEISIAKSVRDEIRNQLPHT